MTSVAATKPISREALVQEALKRGIKEDVLHRAPTYAIMSMIQDRSGGTKKTERKKDEKDIRAHVKQSVEQLSKEHKEKSTDDDDNVTVVDMSFVTSTENPADQKYKRFTSLVAMKNNLVEAIKNNSQVLQTNKDHLDEDDIMVMDKDIKLAQHQLTSVNTEIREIHQWFQEVSVQKQQYYEQLLKKSNDISGNLTSHFQRKTENIKKYIIAMQEQAQNQ